MKKLLRIGNILVLSLILVFSVGCSSQSKVENGLIYNKIITDEISFIEMERGIYKKTIKNKAELEKLVNELQEIESINNPDTNPENIDDIDVFRINIINKDDESRISISIIEEFAFYQGKWQPIGESSYNNISRFYYSSNSIEKEDELLMSTKMDRLTREKLSLTKALEGIWLSEKGLEIKFIDNKLYQGNGFEYSFRYDIEEALEDTLKISIYGTDGMFVNEKNLANMDIIFDQTKSHMKMKKTMAGGMIYYDKLIYVNGEGDKLGNFDNLFFLEDS